MKKIEIDYSNIILMALAQNDEMEQKDLAKLTDIDPATVNKIVSGERKPTVDQWANIMAALRIDPLSVYTHDGPEVKYRRPDCASCFKNSNNMFPFGSYHLQFYFEDTFDHVLAFRMFVHDDTELVLCNLFTEIDRYTTRILKAIKGEINIIYPHGSEVSGQGLCYLLKGYETFIRVKKGTVVNCYFSGPRCHELKEKLVEISKDYQRKLLTEMMN